MSNARKLNMSSNVFQSYYIKQSTFYNNKNFLLLQNLRVDEKEVFQALRYNKMDVYFWMECVLWKDSKKIQKFVPYLCSEGVGFDSTEGVPLLWEPFRLRILSRSSFWWTCPYTHCHKTQTAQETNSDLGAVLSNYYNN